MTSAEIVQQIAALDVAEVPAVLAAVAARLAQGHQESVSAEDLAHNIGSDANLTIEEAAALIRRSKKWIYRHRAALPFLRKLGPRSYVCSRVGLEKWLGRRGQ